MQGEREGDPYYSLKSDQLHAVDPLPLSQEKTPNLAACIPLEP